MSRPLFTIEEFSANPVEKLREICRFLDVDAGFDFARGVHANKAAGRRSFDHPLWRKLREIPVLTSVSRAVVLHVLRQRLRYMIGVKVDAKGVSI